MDLGKIGNMGLGNLGSGILGNHKKGGIRRDDAVSGSLEVFQQGPPGIQMGSLSFHRIHTGS